MLVRSRVCAQQTMGPRVICERKRLLACWRSCLEIAPAFRWVSETPVGGKCWQHSYDHAGEFAMLPGRRRPLTNRKGAPCTLCSVIPCLFICGPRNINFRGFESLFRYLRIPQVWSGGRVPQLSRPAATGAGLGTSLPRVV